MTEAQPFSPPKPEFLLRICGTDNHPIATVGLDGTVTIHKDGSQPEAARIFWEQISATGTGLYQQLIALRGQFEALRRSHEAMLQAHAELQRQYHALIDSREAAEAGKMH